MKEGCPCGNRYSVWSMDCSCEMYELLVSLRGEDSSWASYVVLREQQSLTDIREATIKHLPEVSTSPCWPGMNLEDTSGGGESLVAPPAVAPDAWGTCRLIKALIWPCALSLPFSLAISHVPLSPLTTRDHNFIQRRGLVWEARWPPCQRNGLMRLNQAERDLERTLVWNNLSRHLVKADVEGWVDSSEGFFLDRWNQKAQAEREYYGSWKCFLEGIDWILWEDMARSTDILYLPNFIT